MFGLISTLFSFTPIASEDEAELLMESNYTLFCDGWRSGYVAGYCYRQYGCIEPIVPICPLPRIGEDNYEGGYNRGFLQGLNDKR